MPGINNHPNLPNPPNNITIIGTITGNKYLPCNPCEYPIDCIKRQSHKNKYKIYVKTNKIDARTYLFFKRVRSNPIPQIIAALVIIFITIAGRVTPSHLKTPQNHGHISKASFGNLNFK